VPDDRFEDLGAGEPRDADTRTAAEKFADLDETRPEPDARPPEPPRPSGRYMWVVGVAAIILFVVVGVHQLRAGSGTFLQGPVAGKQLPEFAAPVVGGPDKDANVIPMNAKTDDTKACEVRVSGSLNICDHWKKPVVLSFLFLRGAKCAPQFDRIEKVRREFPGVEFIGVFFERNRDKVQDVVGKHSWRFPLIVDRDGAITNLYAVGGCPATVFAYPGGKVRETRNGDLDERELRAAIRAIAR
jgi:peroxiredoxin